MYRLFLVLSFSFLIVACNNDDNSTTPPEAENSFALNVGNSWEYEVYRYNSQAEEFELVDLIVNTEISASTEINGETYYELNASSSGTFNCEFCETCMNLGAVRDSLGYLVNNLGTILYSQTDEEDYLVTAENWGTIYGKLLPNMVEVSVPAGDFTASVNERYAILPNGTTGDGRDRHLVSDGVGYISKRLHAVTSPNPLFELRLKSYSLVEN